MKKLLLLLFIAISGIANAQYCGNSGFAACTPSGFTQQGITDYRTFPCVKDSVPYSEVIQVFFPDTTVVLSQQVAVFYIRIDSITNLPCGLCWDANDSTHIYPGGTPACIRISGTTYDKPGAYKLNIYGTAASSFGTFPGTLDNLGFQFFLNVVGKNDTCSPIDIVNLNTACKIIPQTNCDFDVVLNSSTPAVNCHFDSTALSVTQPTGSNFKYTWTTEFGLSSIRVDSLINTKIYGTDKLVTLKIDSLGCSETIKLRVTGAGLMYAAKVCYATTDSSQATSPNLKLVFQKDNWFNNVAGYTLLRRDSVIQAGGPVPVDTLDDADPGIFTDNAPLTWPFAGSSAAANAYTLVTNSVCPDSVAPLSDGVFVPTVLRVDTVNAGGFPFLIWNKGTLDNYKALFIYSRYPGGSWRLRFSTNALGDSTWVDLRPDSTQMQYMLGFALNKACNPSAGPVANTAFSNFGSAVVSPEKVYRDTTTVPTGINRQFDNVSVALYPNPAKDKLYVQTSVAVGDLTYRIYNTMGQLILTKKLSNETVNTIDVAELNGGVYTIQLCTHNKQLVTRRFIKE